MELIQILFDGYCIWIFDPERDKKIKVVVLINFFRSEDR